MRRLRRRLRKPVDLYCWGCDEMKPCHDRAIVKAAKRFEVTPLCPDCFLGGNLVDADGNPIPPHPWAGGVQP